MHTTTMLSEPKEPDANEAEENLRVIRNMMERSTKYSTFSGLSGFTAGLASILGCIVTRSFGTDPSDFSYEFLIVWTIVILVTLLADYLITKRRAASVGKRVLSRLGKQMVVAAAPGLGLGVIITLYLLQRRMLGDVYPFWMLCYGTAVCATGLFSQSEVKYLGASFLIAGTLTMFNPSHGLTMMAVTFGGFHIIYGYIMSRKDGW